MYLKNAMAIALSVLLLAGCDVSTPSQVVTQPIQLRDAVKTAVLDPARPDAAAAKLIADDYKRDGKGDGLSLVFSYAAGDPQDKAVAEKHARAWRALFVKHGVAQVKTEYVEMTDPQYLGRAIVSYTALSAEAPKDCGRITGYQGADVLESGEKYGMGCESETALSKMVVDPSDLMGKGGTPDDDSRRDGALVEKYKAGTPNPKMQGMSASSVGSSASSGGAGG